MALVKPVIFQVVGYQNSGKTTFMTQIINGLTAEGLKVVTIKHHGHGGKPDIHKQKDSARHIESGAAASIVEGNGRLLLQSEKPVWTLTEEIKLMEFFEPDIILIEGYKREKFPKLLLVRDKMDAERLKQLENVKAIVIWNESLMGYMDTKIPCFHINDSTVEKKIIDRIMYQLRAFGGKGQ